MLNGAYTLLSGRLIMQQQCSRSLFPSCMPGYAEVAEQRSLHLKATDRKVVCSLRSRAGWAASAWENSALREGKIDGEVFFNKGVKSSN